jgi:excisionase family DNA binding protein
MTENTAPEFTVPVIYTADDVAHLLQVSKRTVERATTAGVLPHRQTGVGIRCRRYTPADIEAYLGTQYRVGSGAGAVELVQPPKARKARAGR